VEGRERENWNNGRINQGNRRESNKSHTVKIYEELFPPDWIWWKP
jgi:hypothetical protein